MSQNEFERRKVVCNFLEKNPEVATSDVVKYFLKLNYKRSTIYNLIRRFKNKNSVQRKARSGPKSSLSLNKARRALKRITVGQVAKSYRSLGIKFQCHKNTVKKCLNEMNITLRKRKIVPKVSEKQIKVQKQRLKKLVQNSLRAKDNVIVIQDDETYFTLNGNEWQPKAYFDNGTCNIDEKVKFIPKEKFPDKVLLWLAISQNGMSEPAFFKAGLAINSERYKVECLPKVKKCIRNHHANQKTLFWPDLASAHYSKASTDEMRRLGIRFVPKEENPPNVPQLRPIEDFWANLKRKVYSKGYQPKNINCLITKIKATLRELDTSIFKSAMKRVPLNVRKAQRTNVNQFLH